MYHIILVSLSLFCIVIMCNITVLKVSHGRETSNIDLLPYNEVALLLGAPPLRYNNTNNLFFVYRIQAALLLFKAKKINKIVLSGNVTETTAMLLHLKKMGIPNDSLLVDNSASRTIESITNMQTKFGYRKFTIISQRFHNKRAIFCAKCIKLDVVAYNAQNVYGQRSLIVLAREILARTLVYIDIGRILFIKLYYKIV